MGKEKDKVSSKDPAPNTRVTVTGATTATTDSNPSSRLFRPSWNVMAVRGKVTDKCFWSACKAMTAGVLLIMVGAGMATLGFYSDHLSTVEETKGNTTVWVKNESKDTHLGSLTYLGPVVMGVGGFTIVAACVMTFEARDTASKIVPIWFRRTRIHVVSGGSGSTPSGRSSKSSWERFLAQQRTSEDGSETRSALTQAFINFSRYLQSNVDASKLKKAPVVSQPGMALLRKCPSEPSLTKSLRACGVGNENEQESLALLEVSTPQPTQRTSYGGGLRTMTRQTKPQLLSVAPDTYRQAVSMDYPRPPRLARQETDDSQRTDNVPSIPILNTEVSPRLQTLHLQASCTTTSSSGSMSVDIYLPQGAITLKVHDDNKDISTKKSTVVEDQSHDNHLNQPSDMQSLEEDDFSYPEVLDDNVFISQDNSSYIETPQIILEDMNIDPPDNSITDIPNQDEYPSVEEWISSPFSICDTSAESMEVQSSPSSPPPSSTNTQLSFEFSDPESPGVSITSVISIPQTSQISSQWSFSPTENSYMNVSPLQSFDSTQELQSPLGFPNNAQSFPVSEKRFSTFENDLIFPHGKDLRYEKRQDLAHRSQVPTKPSSPIPRKHFSVSDSMTSRKSLVSEKNSPKKHRSLESAELNNSKNSSAMNTIDVERQYQLLEGTEQHDPVSPHYLSPHVPIGAPGSTGQRRTFLTFSPRKTRSESLPERRPQGQTPSLKRFPLMRQVALDAFAEEGTSSTTKINISPAQSLDQSFYPKT